MDEKEFIAALRLAVSSEHYPFLHLLADNAGDPKHIGGIIYEGVRVTSRTMDTSSNQPVYKINLESPEFIQIPHTQIRWFSRRGNVRYWNGAHPLIEKFHGMRGHYKVPTPAWLVKACAETQEMCQVGKPL